MSRVDSGAEEHPEDNTSEEPPIYREPSLAELCRLREALARKIDEHLGSLR